MLSFSIKLFSAKTSNKISLFKNFFVVGGGTGREEVNWLWVAHIHVKKHEEKTFKNWT